MPEPQDPGRFKVPGRPLNLAEVFLYRHIAEGRGSRRALIIDASDGGCQEVSYAALAQEASRYGHLLKAKGIRQEDRVLIVLEDGLPWAAAFFGAQRIGTTTAFVNPAVGASELAFYLEDSRARAIITTAAIARQLTVEASVVVVEVDGDADAIAQQPTELPAAPTLDEDFAIWLFTSGSTGAPKAAVHRARDFVFNTERYAQEVLKMTEDDITVSVPKLFFGYATGSNLLFPLYFGGSAVLFPDKPTPERLLDIVAKHRATILVNVPTMIARMSTHLAEAEDRPDTSSLRLLTSAGEALPPELYRRWLDATGVEILDGIGSAEMFHVFISARLGEVVPGSLGTLVPGYEARIVDPEGREVPRGEVGTLHIGGGSSAAFYWNRQDKSREVLQGYWVRTSDLFRQDEAGYFWYQGRADDTLKVAGRWLQPQEVEACLTTDPAVAEAAVAPFEHDGLTKPMAFVVLAPGVSTEDLAARLAQRVSSELAAFKAPRFVETVESLPRGDRGKLDRPALAKAAQAAAEGRKA